MLHVHTCSSRSAWPSKPRGGSRLASTTRQLAAARLASGKVSSRPRASRSDRSSAHGASALRQQRSIEVACVNNLACRQTCKRTCSSRCSLPHARTAQHASMCPHASPGTRPGHQRLQQLQRCEPHLLCRLGHRHRPQARYQRWQQPWKQRARLRQLRRRVCQQLQRRCAARLQRITEQGCQWRQQRPGQQGLRREHMRAEVQLREQAERWASVGTAAATRGVATLHGCA